MLLDEMVLSERIMEHISAFFYASFFSLITWLIALKWKFFQFSYSYPPLPPIIKGKDVIKGFLSFIFVQVFLIPAFIIVIIGLLKGENFALAHLTKTTRGWLNLSVIMGGFIAVFAFFLTLPLAKRQAIWGDPSRLFHHLLVGILTWFVSFPFVVSINQLLSIVVLWLFRQSPLEQVAVKHLKDISFHPVLFGLTILSVTVCVPILEEFLFRGLLQSWLRSKFKRVKWAIGLTSLTFALFHYSISQGVTNIELISSLFLLSCFLGYLYEQQRSLWAPIGLHSFFNFMSVLMITNGNR